MGLQKVRTLPIGSKGTFLRLAPDNRFCLSVVMLFHLRYKSSVDNTPDQAEERHRDHNANVATASEYHIIWPREKVTQIDINVRNTAICCIVGSTTVVKNYTNSDGELEIWYGFLTPQQVEAIERLNGVSLSSTLLQ